MKKLLSMLLCIVFVCFALVGCAEDVIGEYLENYNNNKVTDDQIEKLNFYIITGNGTSSEAKITVPQNINAYLKDKYKTELVITYCTADEYETVLNTAMNKTNESERPDIILINNESLFNSLYTGNKLVALNDFYNDRDFRSINTIVDRTLLDASSVIDPETNVPTYYTVPNNHVIGQYEYVVIDKSMARDILHFSNEEISAMTTEDSCKVLVDAIRSYYNSDACTSDLSEDEFVNLYVKTVSGNYNSKFLFQYGVTNENELVCTNPECGKNTVDINTLVCRSCKKNAEIIAPYYVNINSYPNATKAEAYKSAFAIVRHLDDVDGLNDEARASFVKHYKKCMQIIFGLNTDVQFKNMLQYGYVGTNYKFVKNEKHENTNYITLEKNPAVIYQMDPTHTGNLYISYYCNEIGWNESIHTNNLKQNSDAKTPSQKLSAELAAFELDIFNVSPPVVVSLPGFGGVYNDIIVTWTSSNEDALTVDANGVLTVIGAENRVNVTLTATFSCAGESAQKTFEITVEPVFEEAA